MHFLAFGNTNVQFRAKKLTQNFNTTNEALPIAWQTKLINKYKFAKITLNKNSDTFVMYIIALETLEPIIYLLPNFYLNILTTPMFFPQT